MDGFNFFFGFYGLLLGFSVAAVTRALAAIVGRRQLTRGTALLFLLGLFMLLDLISLWVFAWDSREHLGVNYPSLYGAMGIAIVYYFAVVVAFPDPLPKTAIAIRGYWTNKRLVIAAIMFANGCTIVHEVFLHPSVLGYGDWWRDQATYWLPAIALLFTKSERSDLILWLILVLGYFAEAIIEILKLTGT